MVSSDDIPPGMADCSLIQKLYFQACTKFESELQTFGINMIFHFGTSKLELHEEEAHQARRAGWFDTCSDVPLSEWQSECRCKFGWDHIPAESPEN